MVLERMMIRCLVFLLVGGIGICCLVISCGRVGGGNDWVFVMLDCLVRIL